MTPEMTVEFWAQIRSTLEEALGLSEPERSAFLAGIAERNPALQREVQELLAAEREATRIFSINRWQQSAFELPVGAPGLLVGRYRLLRELGQGGMGTVYLAERADGEFKHQVAVKLLQPGVLSASMAERFRQERQILARFSHPGIVRLLDGGISENGLLYAVMEYVDGESIDVYCERHGLDLAARIRLFLRVTEAVQYAHQQLVLHLDIKPANLLVTKEGEPRLLDFGISRIVAETDEAAARAAMTLRMLTPRYASPEQAAGEPLGVASDVYSLGTLLYRLVTGALPYPVEEATPLEAARIIRETSPQPPSRVAPPELRAQLRGDLDLILLQALRKEPARRYPTAAAFADDLERYLDSRPVRAHADSLGYRTGRFLRRNRRAVAAAALVLLVIAASVGMVIRSAVVARRQEALAIRRLQEVRQLAHSYIFDLDPQLEGIPGTVAVRGFILQTGMKYLDAMAKEAGSDEALNDELADGYLRLSTIEDSFLYPSLGQQQEARAAMAKAVALATASYQRHPHDLDKLGHYLYIGNHGARMVEGQGDIRRYDALMQQYWNVGQPLLSAKSHPEELIEMGSIAGEMATNRIGNGALWNLAEPAEGLQWAERSIQIMQQVQRENPSDSLKKRAMVDIIYNLATEIDGYIELGDAAAVHAKLVELERRASQPEFMHDPALAAARRVASDYEFSSMILEHRLKEAAALAPRDKVTEMPEKQDNSRLSIATATYLCQRGDLDLELGRGGVGTGEMQKAIQIYEGVLHDDPSDINSSVQVVMCGTKLGVEPLAPRSVRKAALHRAIDISNSYVQTHPDIASPQIRMATAWTILDAMDRDGGNLAEAKQDSDSASSALARLKQLSPGNPQGQLIGSQLQAVDSGKLDHKDDCRQRAGALYLNFFLSGQQQIALCHATPGAALKSAALAPAITGPKPNHAAR